MFRADISKRNIWKLSETSNIKHDMVAWQCPYICDCYITHPHIFMSTLFAIIKHIDSNKKLQFLCPYPPCNVKNALINPCALRMFE